MCWLPLLIHKLSAWERTAAKLCFASRLGLEAELLDLRSQAELGNEGWGCLLSPALQLPFFPEKCCVHDLPRRARRRRCVNIDNCPIGQLRDLPCVVEIVVLAKRETAVEHDVPLRVQRIGVDQHRYMMLRIVRLVADVNALIVPADRQFRSDLRQQLIAARIAP